MSERAVVLSGGGARGAYAAGVLRYIIEKLEADLGHAPRMDILCGSSVGAINAAWVASTIDQPEYSGTRLWSLWHRMRIEEAIVVSGANIVTMLSQLLRDTPVELPAGQTLSLLNTKFFVDLIRNELPLGAIEKNISAGLLDTLTVTATEVHSGRATTFVQTHQDRLPAWTRDPRRRAIAREITSDIVLASAAIPVLFPSVKIGKRWYFDGGLRQNTPIAPAIRMGAEKVLVISLKTDAERLESEIDQAQAPSVSMLLGKMMNALLLDPLDYDLAYLERINNLLERGTEAFGDSFQDTLNQVIEAHRGQPYRPIEPLLLKPSMDLGRLAADIAGRLSDDTWGSRILRMMGERAIDLEYRESDFMSYLLFESEYTGALLELGWSDAQCKHDALVEFFQDK